MSKAVFVTLPFLMFFAEWFGKSNNFSLRRIPLSIFFKFLPFILISIIFGLITIYVHNKTGAIIRENANPLGLRTVNAINSIVTYVIQVINPVNLSAHYRVVPINTIVTIINLISLLTITLLSIKYRKSHPHYLFGLIWYAVLIFPVLGIIQSGYHAHADRYVYLPAIGIYIALVYLLRDVFSFLNVRQKLRNLSALLILFVLFTTAWMQTDYWRNSFSLFEKMRATDNDSYLANTNLAVLHIRTGEIEIAMQRYEQARKIAPYYLNMYDVVSYNLIQTKHYVLALRVLNDLISYDKNYVTAYIASAQILIQQKKFKQAIEKLKIAHELDNNNPKITKLLEFANQLNKPTQ